MVERLVANEKVEGSNPFCPLHYILKVLIWMIYLKKCVACEGNIPPFDTSEIHKYLKKVDDWDVKSNDDKSFYLIKEFKFENFESSQRFVNKVGNLAEEENHHPDISFGWGYCKIKIFTHAIKGLAESDFILAAKIDKID